MSSRIQAIFFDLDGVLTDTAESHYPAWQWLADREGISFDRTYHSTVMSSYVASRAENRSCCG